MPLSRRVDAVLTLTVPLTEEHTLALRALDMPLVTVGAALPGVSCVRIDDVAAMRTAVHHLLHQGHEDIVMITGVEDEADFGFASSRCRREGYREAMAGRRAGPRIDVVSADDLRDRGRRRRDGGADGPADAAHRRRGRVRRAGDRGDPDAAPGEHRRPGPACRWSGVDGHEMASVVDLTTVAQPVQEQGAVAARLLLDTLADAEARPDRGGPADPAGRARQHRHAVVAAVELTVSGSFPRLARRSTWCDSV